MRKAGARSDGRARRSALIAVHYLQRAWEKDQARQANVIRLAAFRARRDGGDGAA